MNILSSIWRKRSETEVVGASTLAVAPRDTGLDGGLKQDGGMRFIARQAIFDREQKVHGYELLCRSGWENSFRGDPEAATQAMISDGALYGFSDLTKGAPSFVNCTRDSLVSGLVTLLPNTTVLEILETVTPDAEVLQACAHYKKLGYKLALDDFRHGEGMDGLIGFADYVKVDFRLSDAAERRAILHSLRGKQIVMVAEKVETEEEFQTALDEGFELFQGYFFCHPTVFSKRRAPMNGVNYLHLLSALSEGRFDVVQLTSLLKAEVDISYRLLRLVNSARFGLNHEVRSLQDALVLVGEEQFRKLMMNAIATETCRKRPSELLIHVLHRARFLELMAPYTGESATEQYLFGLLSLMDAMLDMPTSTLIEALPLRKEIKDALSGEHNKVNAALRLLECYEDADWGACEEQSLILRIGESTLTRLYRESLLWAEHGTDADRRVDSRSVQ